jgi:hypothetical protein
MNQKVARSIPNGVDGIFHRRNLSGRNLSLGSTQANKNYYQECFLKDKGGRCLGLTNLSSSCT